MPFRYPVSLEVGGRRCVVIGGGAVGEQKARGLAEAGAAVGVVAEEFTPGLEELGARGTVTLIRKPYSDGDLEGAMIAIAATGDPLANEAIHEEAQRRGVLLNAVDDNAHCDFAVPSILRHGDFLMTISTGGRAPALSKRLRKDLSARFGPEYGALVELLGRVREELIGSREVGFETWAQRWQEALAADLIELVRAGRDGEAADLVRGVLAGLSTVAQ